MGVENDKGNRKDWGGGDVENTEKLFIFNLKVFSTSRSTASVDGQDIPITSSGTTT